jgi:hypothetical protein
VRLQIAVVAGQIEPYSLASEQFLLNSDVVSPNFYTALVLPDDLPSVPVHSVVSGDDAETATVLAGYLHTVVFLAETLVGLVPAAAVGSSSLVELDEIPDVAAAVSDRKIVQLFVALEEVVNLDQRHFQKPVSLD